MIVRFLILVLSIAAIVSCVPTLPPNPTPILPTAIPSRTPTLEEPSVPATAATIDAVLKNVTITGESDGAPPHCTPQDIAEFIMRFMDAFNRGDQAQLAQVFFPGGSSTFQWYSMTDGDPTTGGRHFVAYDQATLMAYFVERHRQHEVMRLVALQVNGWEAERGIVHFGPVVVARRADDINNGERIATGKGAFRCEQQALVVWSVGMQ